MTQLLMKRKEEGKKGRREKKKRKRKRKGKEKRRGKKNPNFTLSGSPGACGFSLLTLKRKRRREKKGEKEEGEKKKKKKRIIMHQRKSLSQTSLCQGPQERLNSPFM